MSKLCCVGGHLPRGKWWLWVIAGLLALYLLMLFNKWRDIESDVQSRTQAALNESGFRWTSIDQFNKGRDVLITGQAPDQEAIDGAVMLAKSVNGVRIVQQDISIVPLPSSEVHLVSENGVTTLSGTLPSQSDIDQFEDHVRSQIDTGTINNQMIASETVGKPAWLAHLMGELAFLSKVRQANISANDEHLIIRGEVDNKSDQLEVSSNLSSKFGSGFSGEFKIVPPGPTAEELAQLEAERLAKIESQRARLEAERLATIEADKARLEAERLAGIEANNVRLEAERLAEIEANKARLEAERLAVIEADKARLEAERLAEIEADKARLEAERLAEIEAEKARLEAERLATIEADKARQEAERLAGIETEKARLEAEQLAKAEAKYTAFLSQCQSSINEITRNGKIEFASSSTELENSSFSLLDNLVKLIRECNQDGKLQIEISGHTDSTGDPALNLVLSESRAQSVLSYLQQAGVARHTLSAIGYGDARPIADNSTALGRAQNRRIQFNIQQ